MTFINTVANKDCMLRHLWRQFQWLNEIAEDENVVLHLKKGEQTLIKHPASFDAGSTISALTPRDTKR